MVNQLLILANTTEAAAPSGDIFSSLGIDWKLLLIQILAFLVLTWFLAKFVFPPITNMLEKRDEEIERAAKAAKEAEAKAEKAQAKVEALLRQARTDAADIVATAKDEARDIVAKAEEKSQAAADKIVSDAHDEIGRQVAEARKILHNETIDLVGRATEKVAGKALTDHVDNKLIAKAISEVK